MSEKPDPRYLSTIPEMIDNEKFLQLMKISKRLAATWRETGVIGYCKVGGTIRYLVTDVQELLKTTYVKKEPAKLFKR